MYDSDSYYEDDDPGLITYPDDADHYVFDALYSCLWQAFDDPETSNEDRWDIASYYYYICMNTEKYTIHNSAYSHEIGYGDTKAIVQLGKISKYIINGYEDIRVKGCLPGNYALASEMFGLYHHAVEYYHNKQMTMDKVFEYSKARPMKL